MIPALMVLGLVVALLDIFTGTGNSLRWLNVVIYLLFTLGFGYFSFAEVSWKKHREQFFKNLYDCLF